MAIEESPTKFHAFQGESGETSTLQVEELNLLLKEREEAAEKLKNSEEELGHLKKSIVGLRDELDDHKEKFEVRDREIQISDVKAELFWKDYSLSKLFIIGFEVRAGDQATSH